MRTTSLVVLCAAAAFTLPLGAQGRTPGPRIGFGITVPDLGVLVPINVSAHLRIEPYVNFFSVRADFPFTSDTAWESRTQIGVGLFSVAQPEEKLAIYFGPRVGLLWGSSNANGSSGSASTTTNGWFLAAAVGGEYSPTPRFSVGAVAKLEFDHTSYSASGGGSIPPSLDARAWYSTGALVVRFYP